MKYIMLLLFSVSVMAVDEISQTVTTRINTPVTFAALSPNTGRGDIAYPPALPSIWKLRYAWTNGGMTARILFRTAAADGAVLGQYDVTSGGLPSLSGQPAMDFAIWTGAQSKPLNGYMLGTTFESGPTNGVSSFAAPNSGFEGPSLTYTPSPNFVGSDSLVLLYNADARLTITINVINDAPTIALSASPAIIQAGGETSFAVATADANGQKVSVSYDYGDGSSGINATHAYAASGTYTVIATADDGFGGKSTAQTVVTVVGSDHLPKARFTTSDIVAFVGVPFVLDGITSTDEQNSIVSYSWNFGDDTPLGSVATLSHIYKSVGLVTVTLTVTDAEGFSSTVSREVEVLSEQAAATFDSEVRVTSTFYPLKQNRDILTVFARVNVGDTTLGAGSAVALEYGGKRFTTTLDKRGKAAGWVVKQNLRRQTPGTVEITFKARNTAVAESLTSAGAVDGGTVDIPFRLELGPKTILVDVATDFDLTSARGKAAGELE